MENDVKIEHIISKDSDGKKNPFIVIDTKFGTIGIHIDAREEETIITFPFGNKVRALNIIDKDRLAEGIYIYPKLKE
jgi:hypothetical protein